MLDHYGRDINYLRVSITDRCNLRCRYCMPESGITKLGHRDILSLEEIVRLVRVASGLGIRKVRLTGGEPLVRKNIVHLVDQLASIPTIDDLAVTTNGVLFAPIAEDLKAAGLNRVNFSLDSLVPEKFTYITRIGNIEVVKRSIFKALELGLDPVKLNVVIIRGFNDDEVNDFVKLAVQFPLHVRFIEFMPIGDLLYWEKEKSMTVAEIKSQIEQQFNLIPAEKITGNGPAKYYGVAGGEGTVGFISPMSNHFCGKCNRIRMTAEGKLRGCLYDCHEINLKSALQEDSSDEVLRDLFCQTINSKPAHHQMETGWGADNERKMYQIGG